MGKKRSRTNGKTVIETGKMGDMSREVRDLVESLKGLKPDHYEYLEVKQLAEILARHRAKARAAVDEYRLLKRAAAAETDPVEKLYLNYEGMFLRDHLRDALRLYVMINHDFHEAYQSYMDALKAENSSNATPVFNFVPAKKAVIANTPVTKMSQRRLKRA